MASDDGMVNECEAVGGMRIGRETRSTVEGQLPELVTKVKVKIKLDLCLAG
jgi:hypothetical protein